MDLRGISLVIEGNKEGNQQGNKLNNHPVKTWNDYLKHDLGFRPLVEKSAAYDLLCQDLKKALISLGLESWIDQIKPVYKASAPADLFLKVSNPGIGSKLQQLLPSLQKELLKSNLIYSSIQIQIRPIDLQIQEKGAPKEKLSLTFSASAKNAWKNLLQKLPADSALRKSVEDLLKRIN
jgi:hypothetical protein